MYSNEKSVQILIALLKQNGIKHVVLSPGGSDAPVVKSFENDDFFVCYSVVDERSSVFFGIGLSQELKEPVVCVCTSGTAVSNFLTGMTEAYYQEVPIIAVTTDSHPYNYDQLELQKLNQDDIFRDVVRKEVTLPAINNEWDEWHCNRIINEAILELDHHGRGPIHINVPITKTLQCTTTTLDNQRMIKRTYTHSADYSELANRLIGKKVLVVVGENTEISSHERDLLNAFYERYNCIFNVETISNLKCNGCVTTYTVTETGCASHNSALVPDIVISLGNFIASYLLKPLLRANRMHLENWLVHESGSVRDPYWCLTEIIEGSHIEFFERLLEVDVEKTSTHSLYESWKGAAEHISLGELGFCSLGVAKELSETMPDGSVLHTAILNSTRIMQFFPPKNNVKCYCNLGALGIDGCTPTTVGHSMASDKLTYLLTGDLSFFYGMNAVSIRDIKNNLRIVMFNNGGGEEFKIKLNLPELDKYVCARSSHRIAKGWIESLGWGYRTATTIDDVRKVMEEFAQPSDKPLFLELFLDIERDAKIIRDIYASNQPDLSTMDMIKIGVAKVLPKPIVEHIKNVLK